MSNDWPIPNDLSSLGRKAAELIHQFFVDNDIADHGGGGHFYSPAEWEARGEEYGVTSLLVITHDGGSHATALNSDYENYDLIEQLREHLGTIGVHVERCTSWYSAVYKS